MKIARMLPRAALGVLALFGAGIAGAQTPASVTLSDVYGLTFPVSVPDPYNGINSKQQSRAMAVNNNPGSPWQGTLYMTLRRGNVGTPPEAPATIMYWKPQSTSDPLRGSLKFAGPDLANADGHFTPPENFSTHGNAWWGIAVADDDLVYSTSLNSGDIYRFDPDLKNPVKITPNMGTAFIRFMEAYGKGINTEIWFNRGDSNGDIIRLKATAVDAQNRPTAFAQTLNIPLKLGGSAHMQGAPNNARDAYYMAYFAKNVTDQQGPAKISLPGGVRDTSYPAFQVASSTGLQIDSMDRVIYTVGYGGTTANELYALDPLTGANLTNPSPFVPMALVKSASYGNHIFLSRYSDRHYFYSAMGVNGAPANAMGVVATDLPAPAPKNIRAKNMGTGSLLQINWTPADDPEVTGVFIYRSTTPGVLGTQLNTAPITGTSYNDSGLTSGQTYYYTLESQGLDPFTELTYEGVQSAQVLGTPTVLQSPVAPTGISVTDPAQGGELLVKWTTPVANAEVINIYRSETAGALGTLVKEVVEPAAGVEGSYLDTNLTNGKTYYYTVRAANVVGESPNTEQFSGVPTDSVVPTFAGVKTLTDLGFPGVRVSWDAAQDRSTPITYSIYAAPSVGQLSYATPVGSVTNQTTFDLKGLAIGQDVAVVVRAEDSAGNEESNTKVLLAMPTRVIVDPDMSGGANRDKFNPQPDPAFPALIPEIVGSSKGNAPDLIPVSFGEGGYYYQTNDQKGKSSYTLTIPVAGNYDISAWWTSNAKVNTPNYTFHITYPNGATEDVVVNQTGGSASTTPPGNGSQWNLLVDNKQLTPGTLTIVGDATTSPSTDPLAYNVSVAVRALLNVVPEQVTIYTATAPITVDANITDAEWSGANTIVLGKANQDVIGGKWTGPADYSANIRLKWNTSGLYVAGQVKDDILSFKEGEPTASHSFWDSLEVFLGIDPNADPTRTAYNGIGDYQILLTGYREGGALKGIMAEGAGRLAFNPEFGEQEVAFAVAPGGYNFEAYIPWAAMEDAGAVRPVENQVIDFNLQGIDNDTVTTLSQDSAFSLSTKGRSFTDPQSWIKALLAGTPPARPRGDIDLDGFFTGNDVREALRVAGGLSTVSAEARQAGDVNGDGKITIEDAVQMQKALAAGATP